jgi:ssDNA-binding replication factor A large subunit
MIDISYDDAVQRIHQESGLSIPEIQSRVQAKLVQLSGLVSRDGAVHILANELGVQLTAPAAAVGAQIKIKDISLQSRGISVTGRVVTKYDVRSFNKNGREGKVGSLLFGDDTGVTRVVFWNDQIEVFEQLNAGDVLIVKNPFVKQSYQQDRLELQMNTQSSLVVNPEGVIVADRPGFGQQRPPAIQKYIKDLTDNEDNVEIIATVVQVYDPRFFDACPRCNRKLIGENQCGEHGEVVPSANFSMSAFLDDGTGNMRATFWKQQALRLTKKEENAFLVYRDDPTAFEEVKNDLLGEFVKVVGRVKKNDTFDRLELTANVVIMDVDPAKELESLQKKFETKLPESKDASIAKPSGDSISVIEDDVVNLDDL